MTSVEEELFEAIKEGNSLVVTSILGTEGISDVNKPMFFSRISYNGPKKTFEYFALSSAQNRISTGCSAIGIIYMLSGCIFAFPMMITDRAFALAPIWLRLSAMLVYLPVPVIVIYYLGVLKRSARPDATMLHVAAFFNQPRIIRLLRSRYRADASLRDRGKRSAFGVTTDRSTLDALNSGGVMTADSTRM